MYLSSLHLTPLLFCKFSPLAIETLLTLVLSPFAFLLASLPADVFQAHLRISCSWPVVSQLPKEPSFLWVSSAIYNLQPGLHIANGLAHVTKSFELSELEIIFVEIKYSRRSWWSLWCKFRTSGLLLNFTLSCIYISFLPGQNFWVLMIPTY